jgi:flagellin
VVLAAPSGVNNILGYTAPVFGDDVITITNDTVGTGGNGKTVAINETSNTSLFNATTGVGATVDSNGNITVSLDNTRTDIDISDIANAIDGLAGYTATVSTAGGGGVYDSTTQTAPTVANTANGAAAGGLAGGVVFELAGLNGSEVLSFGVGTSLQQLVDGINLVKDATGVEAEAAGTTLQLRSTDYGSTAIVDLKVISEDNGATLFTSVADKRDEGTDISATVNGVVANGKGNQLTINTATLDLKASIEADFEGIASFTIVGGGALFQLGPDVVSNQQARLGVTSVNTARLGGVAGKLYELANGNAASLAIDPTSAARIVEEAIDQITSLRGRLGAFQRTTLETNKNALNDTLVNLSDAESSIRDADFAEESAALTRAQILVQAGSTVLQIANSNPQNVLALLR